MGQAERFGKDGAQDFFPTIARCPQYRRFKLRSRQSPAIQFAIGRQRQGSKKNEGCGHHVLGQVPGQVLAQRTGFDLLAGFGHHIRDQSFFSRFVLAREHHHLGNLAMPCERRFDFAEFDAETAQLHLVVRAAQEVQHSIRPAILPNRPSGTCGCRMSQMDQP